MSPEGKGWKGFIAAGMGVAIFVEGLMYEEKHNPCMPSMDHTHLEGYVLEVHPQAAIMTSTGSSGL